MKYMKRDGKGRQTVEFQKHSHRALALPLPERHSKFVAMGKHGESVCLSVTLCVYSNIHSFICPSIDVNI